MWQKNQWSILILALVLAGASALAQQGGNAAGDGAAPPPPPAQRPDPAQGVINRAKQQLGMTEEQFQALEPKLQLILQLERSLNTAGPGGPGSRGPNGPGGFGGPGGPGFGGSWAGGSDASMAPPPPPDAPNTPPPPSPQQSPVQLALQALRAAIANPASTPDDLKAKVDAYREARTKAKTALAEAQKDLKESLTPHQQAVLIALGILE